MEKVYFNLEESWHGSDSESLWAERLANNRFRLRNVPFFVKGVSVEDIVSATKKDGQFVFKEVLEKSGHSTYRIIIYEETSKEVFQRYWDPLEAIGCTYEKGKGRLYAIDVPPSTEIYLTYNLLEKGEKAQVWDFEEGYCGHSLN